MDEGSLIASLPSEGRAVFRRMHDGAAQRKLDQANASADLNAREVLYQGIVTDYPLCAAAAEAALALGDLRYEQGRFPEAAQLYRFSAEHSLSPIDDAPLMARRLFALSRAKLWREFDELAQYAAFRHPDTPVRIAGQTATLPALIERLSATRDAGPEQSPTTHGPRLALPTGHRPVFEHPLISEALYENLRLGSAQNNMLPAFDTVFDPVLATDGRRLFAASLGSVARLDPQTGSELWRVGDVVNSVNTLRNNMYLVQRGYDQDMVLSGELVLAVLPDENAPHLSRLVALDAETGSAVWDWRQTVHNHPEYRHRPQVIGRPLVVEDTVYVVTRPPDGAEAALMAVDRETGEPILSLDLGSAAMVQGLSAPGEMSPRLVMGQSHLYVQTNNGALIAVDTADHAIAWAFTQQVRASWIEIMQTRGMAQIGSVSRHVGRPVTHDGIVITKDTRSNTIYAFSEHDATRLWSADTEPDSTIVHHDAHRIYVLGDELAAYDIRTGERLWWTPHPGTDPGQAVFTDDACLIAGSRRLCRVDLATGMVIDFQEDTMPSGDLLRLGDRLLRVTDQSVTAYRLPTD